MTPNTPRTVRNNEAGLAAGSLGLGERSILGRPRSIDEGLTCEEQLIADAYFHRLKDVDRCNVRNLISVIHDHAVRYLGSDEPGFSFKEFQVWDIHNEIWIAGEAFFALYGIGGYVNKNDERKDIDLLLATNMRYRYDHGYTVDSEEPVWKTLCEQFTEAFVMSKKERIPNNYNLARTKGKCLIKLTPKSFGKSIDLIYVKSMSDHFGEIGEQYVPVSVHKFGSEQEFIKKDVDADGVRLARTIIYRIRTQDFAAPPPRVNSLP